MPPTSPAPDSTPALAGAPLALGRSRWEVAGLWVWGLLALGIAIRIGLVEADPRRNNVYLKVFAEAGDAFAQGRSLYYLPDGTRTGFRYPPLTAAVFTPFALCGPIVGSLLWRALNFGVLLAGLRACFRAGFPCRLDSAPRGVLLVLVALAGITSFNNGQTNPLVLGLFLLATTATLAGRALGPAVATGTGVILKLYPIAYAGVLGALRPRQILWLVPVLGLGLLLPFALQDSQYIADQYRDLQTLLQAEDRSQDGLWNRYRDLRLVTESLGFLLPERVFQVLQVIGGGAIVGLCLWLRRAGAQPKLVLDYAFSLTMCWFMLLGPATEKATYILVAPSVVWPLLQVWPDRHRRRGTCAALVVANACMLTSLFPIDLSRTSDQVWRWCFLPYAVLILTLVLGCRAADDLRQLRRGEPSRRAVT